MKKKDNFGSLLVLLVKFGLIGFIVYLLILAAPSLLLLFSKPNQQKNTGIDYSRKYSVNETTNAAKQYCITYSKCAESIEQIIEAKLLNPKTPYDLQSNLIVTYNVNPDGKNCTVTATLSDNSLYTMNCNP